MTKEIFAAVKSRKINMYYKVTIKISVLKSYVWWAMDELV